MTTQARNRITLAELRNLGEVVVEEHFPLEFAGGPSYGLEPGWVSRTYPPCPGCGGGVHETRSGAYVIDTRAKTVTFNPCGCVLHVPDMPDGWRP